MKFLPHPSSMREWLKSFNYNPGILAEALDTVRKLINKAHDENKKLYFNLTVDEMSIRKQVLWNKNKNMFEGFVDLGLGSNTSDDNAPAATNVIVFMLVCINSHFKMPIAYYFINSLAGAEKHTLMMDILNECFLRDIDVRHITFDGASSNISMAEQLGSEIYGNTEASFFESPVYKTRIYTSLDACHMVKLARNTLASTDLQDENDNRISWNYIEALVAHQEKEGLHAVTKIRKRHVKFENEKMKVSLAVQVLSTSS